MTIYPENIVGLSRYDTNVRRCRVGDSVSLVREHGNPHDDNAIAIESSTGHTIGYLSRHSPVREAILEEGKGCVASIDAIENDESDGLRVTLLVELRDAEMPARYYGEPHSSLPYARSPEATKRSGTIAKLFGSC